MEKFYLDTIIALFFLTALVMVLSTRKVIVKISAGSFAMLSTGLSLLALMSVATAVQNQLASLGLLAPTVVAAGEFFRLILLIAGLMFTASGISKWMPLARRDQINASSKEELVAGLTREKRLGQLISSSASIDGLLLGILNQFKDTMSISLGTVYSVSDKMNKAKLVGATGNFKTANNIATEFFVNPLWMKALEEHRFSFSTVSFAEIHPEARGNCWCLPVRVTADRSFLFLIWTGTNPNELINEHTRFAIVSAITNAVEHQHFSTINDFRKKCELIADEIKSTVSSGRSLNEMMRSCLSELGSYVPADFLSITSIHASGICRRSTAGLSGTVLNEFSAKIGADNSYLYQVNESGEVTSYSDLKNEQAVAYPKLFEKMGLNTIVAVPLRGAGFTKGVVTVGSTKVREFSRAQIEVIERAQSSFELILNELNFMEQAAVGLEREKLLKEFVSDIANVESLDILHQSLADTISRATECSIVRVSTIDEKGQYLNSAALVNDGKIETKTPQNGNLILRLLEWHKLSQENGNTVIVSCGAEKNGMSSFEAGQVFGPMVEQAAIVPIKFGDKIYGLVSMGDDKANNESSITNKNIEYVETLVSLAGMATDAHLRRKDALSQFASAAREEIVDKGKNRGLRSQLRSSLTSIIGSLEMIRADNSGDATHRDRFVNIIDKSARKLNEYLVE